MAMHSAVRATAGEKRAFMRVPVALAGKVFFPASGAEQDCIVTDISLGGATLHCDVPPETGAELVLYLAGFDRFAGTVVRADAEETGVRFGGPDANRERIAEKIVLYLSGVLPANTQVRGTERRGAPSPLPRRFIRASGEVVGFSVRDISLTGASLNTAVRPPLGEIVTIGAAKGRVIRHFDEGIALEFVTERV